MFDAYTIFCEVAVERFLLGCQLALAGFLEWYKAVAMYCVYGVVSFIRNIKDVVMCVNPAALEQRKIVYRAFGFVCTQDLAASSIDDYLILDGMAPFLT